MHRRPAETADPCVVWLIAQRQQVVQLVPESCVIPTGHHEIVHTKKISVDYPVSHADAADEPPPSKPGPDRAIGVHVVRRLPRVIHYRVA